MGMSVVGMNLTDSGNLVLFDKSNAVVCQSFDHPTDSLVLGQKLRVGQKLTTRTSSVNGIEQVLLSLSLTPSGLFAQVENDPPLVYLHVSVNFPNTSDDSSYIEIIKGALTLFMNSTTNESVLSGSGSDSSVKYMKFEPDGHLRSYQLDGVDWSVRDDLLARYLEDCEYPTVCGKYGICLDRQCSCPTSSDGKSYFKPVSDRDPKLGCVETVPLSCEASQFQTFLELNDTSYFTYNKDPQLTPDLANIDKDSCREACANNCSCTTAFFLNDSGSCYLVSQVLSLTYFEHAPTHSIALIKAQNVSIEAPSPSPNTNGARVSLENSKKSNTLEVIILGSSIGSLFAMIILIVVVKFLALWRQEADEVGEEYLEQLPGLPTRFTYDDLIAVTGGFSKKLGEGGFGSVFEGTLIDGTKVAVKRLDGLRQIKKSFLAEVETIGNIHHVNLVRLIGIFSEKFHRLLIYEYMSRGSLDEWIFHKSKGSFVLDWRKRRRIIYDIAKGLNYLHEECTWKIIHLDIKPQNILLDEKFNAKIADFGLSKLLDRDQSQAVTTMRGTPGYLAPEWLSATITEKVNVYRFGVVVLEIVCGKKVFDSSQNEGDRYLVEVFKRKVEEGRPLDMMDHTCEDMRLNQPHAFNIMRIASWCLQYDFSRRPSVSMVIKVLDGVMEIPDDLDNDFSHRSSMNIHVIVGQENADFCATTSVIPSILSGPR
ncbi:G-type lectin S-receptor-like serine/threonine-protein kinase SD2-5 [Rhodamnia argentea]|uniref:non-specific serine/threonine protein kinase n=1 Tax=Rhodamnia argentea TaxID=178133 RepID=A0A8B8PAR8_9MYRT|nr:G-type lectin S-receptor-like serine/threonine-protein kinase SD2-5 [Rhodamnia argentea]